jgi:hypothetical protein
MATIYERIAEVYPNKFDSQKTIAKEIGVSSQHLTNLKTKLKEPLIIGKLQQFVSRHKISYEDFYYLVIGGEREKMINSEKIKLLENKINNLENKIDKIENEISKIVLILETKLLDLTKKNEK